MFKKLLALLTFAGSVGLVYFSFKSVSLLNDLPKLEEKLQTVIHSENLRFYLIAAGIFFGVAALLALMDLFAKRSSPEHHASSPADAPPMPQPAASIPDSKPELQQKPALNVPSEPPQETAQAAHKKTEEKAVPPVAYQILALFQKEGRLLDFLMEDISEVDDATLGGAVRPIHEGCRKILRERLVIEPILHENEGETVDLGDKIDPNIVKLTGNVGPAGPYRGVLIHRGWRMRECRLPELVDGWPGDVIAPAEVEIQ